MYSYCNFRKLCVNYFTGVVMQLCNVDLDLKMKHQIFIVIMNVISVTFLKQLM